MAITQVNVLSPEMPIIVEVYVFHFAEDNNIVCVISKRAISLPGSEAVA